MTNGVWNYEAPSSAGNNIEATYYRGKLNIQVENPWAGSTDTGFGYTCYVDMDAERAIAFANWILENVKVSPTETKHE